MSFRYRYIGDMPVVFAAVRKDDKTWQPSKGDEITSDVPISSPLLQLIPSAPAPTTTAPAPSPAVTAAPASTEPVAPAPEASPSESSTEDD